MKNEIKITPEGLKLMIAISNGGYSDGFYGKELVFTKGFEGDLQYLFQALGNIGACARLGEIEKEVSILVVANKLLEEPNSDLYNDFAEELSILLNQSNSPFLRLIFMTEENLIERIDKRASNFNDEALKDFLKKYKASRTKAKKVIRQNKKRASNKTTPSESDTDIKQKTLFDTIM